METGDGLKIRVAMAHDVEESARWAAPAGGGRSSSAAAGQADWCVSLIKSSC